MRFVTWLLIGLSLSYFFGAPVWAVAMVVLFGPMFFERSHG
jgi:hypothetical protein